MGNLAVCPIAFGSNSHGQIGNGRPDQQRSRHQRLDLNSQQIAKWLARPGWSASTRATYHAHLKSWFVWLILMEYRENNPMTKVGAPRRPRGEPKPVANEHMPVLVQTRMHRKTRVMVHLAALAGLRVHEIARVRGEDVDIIAKTITVVGKGEVTAVLPLHPDLVELAKTMPRRGWWFPSRGGRLPHMAPKSVTNTLCGLMIRAEIPGSGTASDTGSPPCWFAPASISAPSKNSCATPRCKPPRSIPSSRTFRRSLQSNSSASLLLRSTNQQRGLPPSPRNLTTGLV